MMPQVLYCPSCEREFPAPPSGPGLLPSCPNDSTPLYLFPRGVHPGDVIDGRYTLERPLGQGGMGIVFAARQHAVDRSIALKFLHGGNAADPCELKRFLREARMSAAITHPNVVTVHDYGQTATGQIYIAMELIHGHLLSHVLEAEAPLSPRRAAIITAQAAEALSAAHARGVIHRDLKPANVFLVPGEGGADLVKVVDFGLAKAVATPGEARSLTATGTVLGTPAYMSPEQIQNGFITPASDFYALGCLLYEMLTGAPPFRGSMLDVIMGQLGRDPAPPSMASGRDDTPKAIERLCLDLLAKDPSKRPSTAAEVTTRLEPWLAKAPRPITSAVVHPISEPVRAARPALKAPFIGRVELRARLEGLMDRSILGREGCLVVLEGPGGVGKSRLAGWLEGHAMRQGWRVARGLHQEASGGALGAIREALQVLERPTRASSLTIPITPPNGVSAPARDAAPSPHDLAPPALIQRVAECMAQEPTLVVLEDLRGSRPFEPDVLEHLAFAVAECERPAMVVLAVRSDAGGGAESAHDAAKLVTVLRDRQHHIRVGPLTPVEMGALIEAALPGADPELVGHVRDHAGGSPLHALQLLRHLASEGALRFQDRGWRLVRQPTMPAELQALLRERLNRLRLSGPEGEAQQALLTRAALLGPRLSVRWLEGLLQREGRYDLIEGLDRRLDRLITDGWLRDLEVWDDDVLQFDHGYVHEALVSMMEGRRAARALHRHAAEALELAFAGQPDVHARPIGEHWAGGGEAARALPWMIRAAQSAEARFVPREALEAWRRAESLLDAAGAGDEIAASVRLGIARQLLGLGQHDEAEETARLLREDDPERLELLGDLADARARDDEALERFTQAAEAWRAVGARSRAASVDLRRGRTLYKRSRVPEAEALYRHVLDVAMETGDKRLEADACNALTELNDRLERRDEAMAFIAREERLRREQGDPVALGRCLYVKMGLHTKKHETALAARDMAEALELLTRAGHRRGLAHTLRLAGVVALGEGRLDEALTIVTRAKVLFERLGDRRGEQRALAETADVYVAMKRFDVALEYAQACLELAESLGPYDQVNGLITVGETLLHAGRAEAAIEPLQRAISLGRDNHVGAHDLSIARAALDNALRLLPPVDVEG